MMKHRYIVSDKRISNAFIIARHGECQSWKSRSLTVCIWKRVRRERQNAMMIAKSRPKEMQLCETLVFQQQWLHRCLWAWQDKVARTYFTYVLYRVAPRHETRQWYTMKFILRDINCRVRRWPTLHKRAAHLRGRVAAPSYAGRRESTKNSNDEIQCSYDMRGTKTNDIAMRSNQL